MNRICRIIIVGLVALADAGADARAAGLLTPRAEEVPFAYLANGKRTWPLLTRSLAPDEAVQVAVKRDGQVLKSPGSAALEFENLQIAVNREGRLEVVATGDAALSTFDLEIEIHASGQVIERQTIVLRPAPPTRPVTYYADFGDDLVYIFGTGVRGPGPDAKPAATAGSIRGKMSRTPEGVARYDKAGFDQYFRRLQNQGIAREILWMFPFAFISDASAYAPGDWDLYQRHARALIHDEPLKKMLADPKAGGDVLHWLWLRDLMSFRLDPEVHRALSESALEHGITLAVSYRPFEQAGSKYYELPVFDASGEFLWSFQPLSSPTVNFRGRDVGFVHYRELLAAMGQGALGQVGEIHLRNVGNRDAFLARYRAHADNLRIVAVSVPPLQSDSFVLVRQADGEFRLTPFREVEERARAKRHVVRGFTLQPDDGDGLVISQLEIPDDYRYILIENPSGAEPLTVAADDPLRLVSKAGTPLGRHAVYLAFGGDAPEEKDTRVGGMTAAGRLHAVFAAAEASQKFLLKAGMKQPLSTSTLVIDRGEPFSREMVDFERPQARASVVRELQAILKYPAFREIYVNTRSHTSLVVSTGDGADGVRPVVHYMAAKKSYTRLGIDLAYAPRSAAQDAGVQSRANVADVAAITEFHAGEWSGVCQSTERNEPWRLARNRGVAQGVRALLADLEAAFPQTRLRVVVPEGEDVHRTVTALAASLPAGTFTYTRSRNNYIQNIGEGLALLDLTGLRAEPVMLGVGPYVDDRILKAYLDAELSALAGNRGSRHKGARGIMYEGQWTLKTAEGRRAREAVMSTLLAWHGEIDEVIVYEAAEWAYRLPWDGFDFVAGKSAR